MLLNMMGIEDNEDVVDLDSRRAAVAVDPKNRVTLAALLHAALTSFPIADSPTPPARANASISRVADAVSEPTKSDQQSREDAA